MKKLKFILSLMIFSFAIATAQAEESSYNLGVAAYKAKNYAEARQQWGKAIEQGSVPANSNLGYLLSTGLGGEKDPVLAVKLWRTAAIKGHSEAQLHLARAYERGLGIEQNLSLSYAWSRTSIESAREGENGADRQVEEAIEADAQEFLIGLLDKLSPQDFGNGKSIAIEYIAKYVVKQTSEDQSTEVKTAP
jgi:hypothetical protein